MLEDCHQSWRWDACTRHTPLAEVNQAIFTWSWRQLVQETARGPSPHGNEIHFNRVKSGVATSQHPVIGDYVRGLLSVLQRACLGKSQELQCFTFGWLGFSRTDCHQISPSDLVYQWSEDGSRWPDTHQEVNWANLKRSCEINICPVAPEDLHLLMK